MASDTNISGGTQTVSSGGSVIGTTVDGGGLMVVGAGGSASNATITSGVLSALSGSLLEGTIFIDSGGAISGAFSIASGGVMNLQGNQTITELAGDGETRIADGATLTLDQATSTTYDGFLNGGGGTFVKDGTGTLTLTHSANTVGNLMVSGGGVALGQNGGTAALTGNAAIYNGGWLGGYGTLTGDITVHAGGTLAAGSAFDSTASADYGGMTISGNVNVASGGIYQVRADYTGSGGTGATDLATITGSAAFDSGAAVRHVAQGNASVIDLTGQYTILTADAGVTGSVDAITASSNLRFLKPVLAISGNDLIMTFERGFIFTDFGTSPSQIAVAAALESLDMTNPDSLATLIASTVTDADDVNALYAQLSGEMHASLTGGLMLLDRDFSRGILHRSGRNSLARTILSASAPAFQSTRGYASIHPRALECRYANNFWADVGYARQAVDGDGNTGRYTLKGPEVSLGYDHIAPTGWLGGVALRYGNRDMKVASRLSEADIESYSVAAYGGLQTTFGPGAARLVLGGAFTRHQIEGKRHVAALGQRLESDYHANSYQLFMEGAYAIPLGRVWLEPFADLAWTAMRVPGFSESGGNAALRADSQSHNNLSQLLGLRLVLPTFCRVNLEAQAGWRHTYGTLDNAAAYTFAEGGNRFGIKGSKLSRDEAVFDLRAEYRMRDNLRLGLEANAAVGERGTALRGGAFIALEW
ncbi:MAG: autotransporter domain-containing protein [Planctomycetaceae bacterium]|nr:autotransporter domain-containing protein [Planctomycetaceae bacterium]